MKILPKPRKAQTSSQQKKAKINLKKKGHKSEQSEAKEQQKRIANNQIRMQKAKKKKERNKLKQIVVFSNKNQNTPTVLSYSIKRGKSKQLVEQVL